MYTHFENQENQIPSDFLSTHREKQQQQQGANIPPTNKGGVTTNALSLKRNPFGDITNTQAEQTTNQADTKKRTLLGLLGSKHNKLSEFALSLTAGSQKIREESIPSQLSRRTSDNVLSPMKTCYIDAERMNISPGIDQKDKDDPQACVEYIHDIMQHFKRTETQFMPSSSYMTKQTDINEKMRSILHDWLVDVHHKFKLLPETLFLTANICDRFLSKKLVSRHKLQLLGVTAMLLAAKYEEIYAPSVNDFVYICASAYTQKEILKMEKLVLATLNFNLTVATPFPFMQRYIKVCQGDSDLEMLSSYIMELSLLDYKMLKHLPSTIAASSVYLARAYLLNDKQPIWSAHLKHYSGYSEQDIIACAKELLECISKYKNSKLQAIRKKYYSPRRGEVAKKVDENPELVI